MAFTENACPIGNWDLGPECINAHALSSSQLFDGWIFFLLTISMTLYVLLPRAYWDVEVDFFFLITVFD